MKRRIICLIMSVFMIVPMCLVGCSNSDDTEGNSLAATSTATANKPITITIHSITSELTTPEAVAEVEEAMSALTKAKFDVNIDLKLYTEDEYYDVIDGAIAAQKQKIADKEAADKAAKEVAKAIKNAGITIKETEAVEETEEAYEMIIDDSGREEFIYPEAEEDQLDIFLMTGVDKLDYYNKQEVLTPLDMYLETSIGKKLTDYIHPFYMTAAKVGGKTLVIPNNTIIGDYQYILINRELFDSCYYDIDNIGSFAKCEDCIKDVAMNYPDYVPLVNVPDPLIEFFADGKSLFGGYFSNMATLGTKSAPKNLFTAWQFTDYLSLRHRLISAGCVGDGTIDEDTKFAVAVVSGDYDDRFVWEEDYYVVVHRYPMANNKSMYKSMYGVSTYAKDPERCVQLLSYLNTSPEIRNIFQYGVENVHYEIDEDGYLVRLNNDYMMDIVNTGNTFIAYPEENMELDVWENGKLANLEAIGSPFCGFIYKNEENSAYLDEMAALYSHYMNRLDTTEVANDEEFELLIDEITAEVDELEAMQALNDVEDPLSPAALYIEWYNNTYAAG